MRIFDKIRRLFDKTYHPVKSSYKPSTFLSNQLDVLTGIELYRPKTKDTDKD